jgi:GNAT superfamily N-acetyltransferase
LFKDHHYLSQKLPPISRRFIALWDGVPVGFVAAMTMPCTTIKNGWRESRLVILPDYQGLGIGMKLSNIIAQMFIDEGKRYFSRTAHPKVIYYREHSPLWKPTSKHKRLRTDGSKANVLRSHYRDNKRICGSFEYIGNLVDSKIIRILA